MVNACRRLFLITLVPSIALPLHADESAEGHAEVPSPDDQVVRVFIFAGQSNMVGSDSKVADVRRFPPFVGAQQPQPEVRFSYCIGRENKRRSDGWVDLQPVNGIVGPELSFARHLRSRIDAPLAIIKCAAGGTHLGGDWNPDQPQGFKMYPLALDLIRTSLRQLRDQGIRYRLEGFVWHQGENDMFNEQYMADYGANLKRFLARWRQDLDAPDLRFYIGELCTKTIWGMDLRPRMYAISLGQRAVTNEDEFADYVPTSHVGVEIGSGVGLHYHYGTLGQLEHGVNHAEAYLRSIGKGEVSPRPLSQWPFRGGERVRLFVLAGHRNMEGERAFVAQLKEDSSGLAIDDDTVVFKYSVGGGVKVSDGWEPLGPAGCYSTFGPELSFVHELKKENAGPIAIAKFTHSGSQLIDWTPQGSMAKSRNLYPRWITFVREAIDDLQAKGNPVDFEGVFYHVGENEMSMPPYRQKVPMWLTSLVETSRKDLQTPELKWYVSQQPPTDHERVNAIDVTGAIAECAEQDPNLIHLPVFDLPPQEKQLVLDVPGIIHLGKSLAQRYLQP